MKKGLTLILILFVLLSFVSCGTGSQSTKELTIDQVAGTWILKEGTGEGFKMGGFGSTDYAKKIEFEKTGEAWTFKEVGDKTCQLARWEIQENILKVADDNEYCIMYFEVDGDTMKATKGTVEYIKSE